MIIDPQTFTLDEVQTSTHWENGTVEVSFNGKTRTVKASRSDFGLQGLVINAYGFAGKYATGNKVWPCHVRHYIKTGRESFDGGFDNRASNSRIRTIVGFMDEINARYHSGRSGTRG